MVFVEFIATAEVFLSSMSARDPTVLDFLSEATPSSFLFNKLDPLDGVSALISLKVSFLQTAATSACFTARASLEPGSKDELLPVPTRSLVPTDSVTDELCAGATSVSLLDRRGILKAVFFSPERTMFLAVGRLNTPTNSPPDRSEVFSGTSECFLEALSVEVDVLCLFAPLFVVPAGTELISAAGPRISASGSSTEKSVLDAEASSTERRLSPDRMG